MNMAFSASSIWLRATLVIGLGLFVIGSGFGFYRYVTRPVTFTVAVGSLDGDMARMASAISSQLAIKQSVVRLKILDAGNVLDAAGMLQSGKVDMAVVRSDVGKLSEARSIVRVGQASVLLIAHAGAGIRAIADLKGHTVGVVGGVINARVVAALKKEYDLDRARVTFHDVAPADARQAIASRKVSALLMVMPLTEKYISLLKSTFRPGGKSSFVMIPIDDADAIADTDKAYDSYDIPRGTVQGSPPVPSDDLTTMQVSIDLVASKALNANRMATLTQEILDARDDLIAKYPALAGIAAADTDPDAYITVHPGAAAYYNGTQQSFMDRYGDDIYITPMVLGALASILAGAWRFVGFRKSDAPDALRELHGLTAQIRTASSEGDLERIEGQIDSILNDRLEQSSSDQTGADMVTLTAVVSRLESLIHQRRTILARQV